MLKTVFGIIEQLPGLRSIRDRRRQGGQHMAKEYVLAIDQGTTSTRAMLFRHDGTVAGVAQEEHEQIYPKAGWVEHDPKEIWAKTQQVTGQVLSANGLTYENVAAIGITNQRETTVVWDKNTGEPVYNAVVWQDTRTQPIVTQWKEEGYEDEIKRKTGLVIATYFSGTKIAWILENVEGARQRAEAGDLLFGNTDTWLIWNLTGGVNGGHHITDYTNASRTMLFNLAETDWDDHLMERLGVPRSMLPELRPSSDRELYGMTKSDGVLGGEVPICGDAGDQQAALFGQTCFDVGQAKNTYGTGNFLLQNIGQNPIASKSGLLTTGFYALERGKSFYALEGSIAITGAAVQWLRDNLKLIANADETEEIAKSVEDSGGAYFVPAFSGLFAPYWDEKARGAIVGLTRYVNRAHLVRATLESMCYQSRDVADAVEKDSGKALPDLRVDGGAVKNNFLMQLQADILGIPVIRPQVAETTALGAAYLAGLAVGYWSTLDEMRDNWQVDRTFEPTWSEDQRETGYTYWKKAIERTRNWID
jgi:glycerol kinase